MAGSTDYILAAGAITAANEAFFAPAAGVKSSFNWRIIPATAIAALLIAGIDQLSPAFGKGVAITALVTTLFTKLGNAPSPAENLVTALGYGHKK